MIPAPWLHRDEPMIFDFMKEALEHDSVLEVVSGSAPGWSDPWSRARRVRVVQTGEYGMEFVDEDGMWIDARQVQLMRAVDIRH